MEKSPVTGEEFLGQSPQGPNEFWARVQERIPTDTIHFLLIITPCFFSENV